MEQMTYATRNDVLSEKAFLELTGLSSPKFRQMARDGEIPGAVVLGHGKYVVVMEQFVRAHTDDH